MEITDIILLIFSYLTKLSSFQIIEFSIFLSPFDYLKTLSGALN
jgi:hypothetical protein